MPSSFFRNGIFFEYIFCNYKNQEKNRSKYLFYWMPRGRWSSAGKIISKDKFCLLDAGIYAK
jgi:hypothetical protein